MMRPSGRAARAAVGFGMAPTGRQRLLFGGTWPVAGLVLALLALAPAAAARLALPPHGDRSVHDLSRSLSPQVVELLEDRHRELFQKSGVALVVVLVPRLEDET